MEGAPGEALLRVLAAGGVSFRRKQVHNVSLAWSWSARDPRSLACTPADRIWIFIMQPTVLFAVLTRLGRRSAANKCEQILLVKLNSKRCRNSAAALPLYIVMFTTVQACSRVALSAGGGATCVGRTQTGAGACLHPAWRHLRVRGVSIERIARSLPKDALWLFIGLHYKLHRCNIL